ncbi:hypothetical protein JHL18_02235 [Clostridium sp. YIM B02505]|uniref:Uncharacterized protein n=1 Tax=Clostridium yunnanense TaxID=2800325 RepID=A0ABS1EJB8_9CLOT|nr:hypothetical protein [Clostridium yunnanense]MBK1809464.1 hypothetical protein [Clostridium yunnanense]
MIEYKIGKTFEDMEYEEMALHQMGTEVNNSVIFTQQQTLTWCPISTLTIVSIITK